MFSPIAIETLGAIGPKSLALLKDLGRRIRSELGEPKSTEYLLQRLSVAVQRGNSISVLASTGICYFTCIINFDLLLLYYILFIVFVLLFINYLLYLLLLLVIYT